MTQWFKNKKKIYTFNSTCILSCIVIPKNKKKIIQSKNLLLFIIKFLAISSYSLNFPNLVMCHTKCPHSIQQIFHSLLLLCYHYKQKFLSHVFKKHKIHVYSHSPFSIITCSVYISGSSGVWEERKLH